MASCLCSALLALPITFPTQMREGRGEVRGLKTAAGNNCWKGHACLYVASCPCSSRISVTRSSSAAALTASSSLIYKEGNVLSKTIRLKRVLVTRSCSASALTASSSLATAELAYSQ